MRFLIILSLLATGYTSTYAPGVFEKVIVNRQAGLTAYTVGNIPSYIDGYIAVEDCSLINREVLACFDNSCRHLLVVDCASNESKLWMQQTNIIGEINPELFYKYKLDGIALEMDLYLIKYSGYKFE
jgi:hypothetical protein